MKLRFCQANRPRAKLWICRAFPQCGTPRAVRASWVGSEGEMESGQADAGGHEPGPVLGGPPARRLARTGHDEEEGQLRTFEIEDATLVIEIEPLALEILAMRSVHDLSVTGACCCCEPISVRGQPASCVANASDADDSREFSARCRLRPIVKTRWRGRLRPRKTAKTARNQAGRSGEEAPAARHP